MAGEFYAFKPDNPAYAQFHGIIERATELDWARFEHDDKEVDITLKGIVIARFIPTDVGFRILLPEGPDYRSDMEDSGEDRDGLTRQITMTRDSDIFRAVMSIETAFMWADSIVDDDEWCDF